MRGVAGTTTGPHACILPPVRTLVDDDLDMSEAIIAEEMADGPAPTAVVSGSE